MPRGEMHLCVVTDRGKSAVTCAGIAPTPTPNPTATPPPPPFSPPLFHTLCEGYAPIPDGGICRGRVGRNYSRQIRPPRPRPVPRNGRDAEQASTFRAGAIEAGLKILRENLQRNPRHEQTLGYLVMDAVRRGDAPEARDLVRRLEAVAPTSPATKEMQRLVWRRFGETR